MYFEDFSNLHRRHAANYMAEGCVETTSSVAWEEGTEDSEIHARLTEQRQQGRSPSFSASSASTSAPPTPLPKSDGAFMQAYSSSQGRKGSSRSMPHHEYETMQNGREAPLPGAWNAGTRQPSPESMSSSSSSSSSTSAPTMSQGDESRFTSISDRIPQNLQPFVAELQRRQRGVSSAHHSSLPRDSTQRSLDAPAQYANGYNVPGVRHSTPLVDSGFATVYDPSSAFYTGIQPIARKHRNRNHPATVETPLTEKELLFRQRLLLLEEMATGAGNNNNIAGATDRLLPASPVLHGQSGAPSALEGSVPRALPSHSVPPRHNSPFVGSAADRRNEWGVRGSGMRTPLIKQRPVTTVFAAGTALDASATHPRLLFDDARDSTFYTEDDEDILIPYRPSQVNNPQSPSVALLPQYANGLNQSHHKPIYISSLSSSTLRPQPKMNGEGRRERNAGASLLTSPSPVPRPSGASEPANEPRTFTVHSMNAAHGLPPRSGAVVPLTANSILSVEQRLSRSNRASSERCRSADEVKNSQRAMRVYFQRSALMRGQMMSPAMPLQW